MGLSLGDVLTEQEREGGVVGSVLRETVESGQVQRRLPYVRKDGQRFWGALDVQAVLTDNGQPQGFALELHDLSRISLEKDEEPGGAFRSLVQGITDYAVFMLDPEGRIRTWNSGAERIKGYQADEIIGLHFSRFYTDEDRAVGGPVRALKQAAETGHFVTDGWRMRKDGTRFWASVVIDAIRDSSGELIGFAKVTRDMTERRAAEEALRESERRFRLLVQGVTDYAIFMLDTDGIITNWNSGAERIKQYHAEEIIGRHFSTFYTQEDRASGKPARALREARENGRFLDESWRVRKDGTRFWASVVIDPIRDDAGKLIGYAKITRDISERRQLQSELDSAREQLFQAQKLEAIGNLTGGIAHDFNNLLTVIRGSIELAERHAAGNERLKKLLGAVQGAAGRAAELTHQLLAFSRRQPLRPEVIEIARQLQETAAFLDRSLRGDIGIEVHAPDDLWPVNVDPRQLELALLNVGLNARDAMPDGGTIRIAASNAMLAGEHHGLRGNFVRVEMADEGLGIPKDLLAKVVEPFFTTKDIGKGSGLGLSQAFGFAQQSGGTLLIDSEVGRGTTVVFYLPARPDLAVGKGAETTAKLVPLARGSILIVEDDAAVAEMAMEALESSGYAPTLANSGREALARLEQDSSFDLVFSDIIMPGRMNGVELAQEIRARFPQLPVLLATGYADAAISDEARRFPLIIKPYQIDDLTARISGLLKPDKASH